MKNLKFSFAAVIAVVALGFTIAAQAGAFETKAVRALDCFRPDLQVKTACTDAATLVEIGDPCNSVAIGQHIFSISGALIDPTQNNFCNGGNFICCVKIVADDAPCTLTQQPNFSRGASFPSDQYEVLDVLCKSVAN